MLNVPKYLAYRERQSVAIHHEFTIGRIIILSKHTHLLLHYMTLFSFDISYLNTQLGHTF